MAEIERVVRRVMTLERRMIAIDRYTPAYATMKPANETKMKGGFS